MKREIPLSERKLKDWSINLEDDYYADKPDELVQDAVHAIALTEPGRFVNLVTHQAAGHPEQGLMDKVRAALSEAGLSDVRLSYIDQCGCGGFVTRAFRG